MNSFSILVAFCAIEGKGSLNIWIITLFLKKNSQKV